MTRTVGRIAALIALSMAAGSATACGQKGNTAPAAALSSAIPDSADQVVMGLRTVLTDQSVAKGLLLSDTAYTFDNGNKLVLRRIHVTFYTPQGEPDGVMTAKAGLYNVSLSRLEATGDVVVIRNDGKRLESQQLVFDQARNQIFTDTAFVLNEPERQLTGIGFESDPNMTRFRCLRACKGIAPVEIPRQ